MGCSGEKKRREVFATFFRVSVMLIAVVQTTAFLGVTVKNKEQQNAYATMMYMGTPRDYEFYVATRVLMKSLARLQVDADLVVIASLDVPLGWPSLEVFKDMIHQLGTGKENSDGADQGFIGGYFPDLLDKPMFNPTLNGTALDGQYRLPLGYQMDASYYYLKLRWSVPCGPNSVITFPGAIWLKPWYSWSWPVLPLGIQWHETRHQTLGYAAEMPIVIMESIVFIGIIMMTSLSRPSISKLCYRHSEKGTSLMQTGLKFVAMWLLLAAYIVPFAIIPCTVHPLVGWSLYFLGSIAVSSIAVNLFSLPVIPVLIPLIGIFWSLLVMAYPWYNNGIIKALAVFGFAFCYAPISWGSLVKVMARLQFSFEREQYFLILGESSPPSGSSKLY